MGAYSVGRHQRQYGNGICIAGEGWCIAPDLEGHSNFKSNFCFPSFLLLVSLGKEKLCGLLLYENHSFNTLGSSLELVTATSRCVIYFNGTSTDETLY